MLIGGLGSNWVYACFLAFLVFFFFFSFLFLFSVYLQELNCLCELFLCDYSKGVETLRGKCMIVTHKSK
jgi:hypothetical protein